MAEPKHLQPRADGPRVRLALAALALPALGCLHRARSPEECRLADATETAPTPRAESTPVDLSGLKPYRNTFFVDRVGPYEHHFAIEYVDIEPSYAQIRARIDPTTGRVHIAVDYGTWGGVGPMREGPPPPPDVAGLQTALERELRARCPDGRRWAVRYRGQYREVDLVEMMALKPGPPQDVALHGMVRLRADESLTRVEGAAYATSGFGVIAASEPLKWVDFVPPPESIGTTLFTDRLAHSERPRSTADAALEERALAAARRFVRGEPSLPLADILAAQGATLLPPGINQTLKLEISFYARPKPEHRDTQQADLSVLVGLNAADAVRRLSRGERSGTVGGVRVRATAVFTPERPLVAGDGRAEVAGTLTVRVEDDRGNAVERSYPAKAAVLVDGDAVAVSGVALSPGTGWPTTEEDSRAGVTPPRAFRGSLPGAGPYSVVDFYVSMGITSDPRLY